MDISITSRGSCFSSGKMVTMQTNCSQGQVSEQTQNDDDLNFSLFVTVMNSYV